MKGDRMGESFRHLGIAGTSTIGMDEDLDHGHGEDERDGSCSSCLEGGAPGSLVGSPVHAVQEEGDDRDEDENRAREIQELKALGPESALEGRVEGDVPSLQPCFQVPKRAREDEKESHQNIGEPGVQDPD